MSRTRYENIIVFFCLLLPAGYCRAQKPDAPVRIIHKTNPASLEIRNGLLGIVIPEASAYDPQNAQQTLAPVQSLIYRDGTYSNDLPVYLHSATPPVSMKVEIIKSDPEECVVQIRYGFHKTPFIYGAQTYPGGGAGPGFYLSTIRLKRNTKSILIEEESDYDIWYQFGINKGLEPDCARYRGWNATSAENGHEPTGKVYRTESERGAMDAALDFNYDKPRIFPYLSLWDPLGGETNTGRYWQVFNREAGPDANLLGFFQGRASRLIGGRGAGPRLVIAAEKGQQAAKESNKAFIQVQMLRRGPDNSWYIKKRLQWALFIGSKRDLLSPEKYQPIGIEMNKVSGLASRIDEYAAKPAEPVAAFFDGAIFMPVEKIGDLMRQVKTDLGFTNRLNLLDPYFKPITDAWRNPDSAKSAIRHYLLEGEEIKTTYKSGDGIHDYNTQYWKGSFRYKKIAQEISCLFADKTIPITPSQRDSLISIVRMLARVQWDDDNVPFFDSSGINFGPANMAYQYANNGRNFFSMLFAKDPVFAARAKNVAEGTRANLLSAINGDGASFGSPHYIQATLDPILFSMLQLKQAGTVDLFREQKDKLSRFIDFYKALLTPPSVRFSGYRKLVSFGDGSEESAVTFALLASGFEDLDSALSNQLYAVFQHGAPRLSLFGDIALAADLAKNRPPVYQSASSSYPGYLSHLRTGINTENETAAWIINGMEYSDHRNNDAGEVAIYALKTPLSLSRDCFYSPRAAGEKIRSLVIPADEFPEWNKANQPINSPKVWGASQLLSFAKLPHAVSSLSRMYTGGKEWFRLITLINLKADQPIILFYDSVNNNKENIWSLLNMSAGPVHTPAGDITPADRVYANGNANLQQLPEATPEKELAPGLQTFRFTGQLWSHAYHSSGGINWDLTAVSPVKTSFTLSQWTNTWQNSQEAAEFLMTNKRTYSETEQILRVKSSAPFFYLLLPYFKGTEPYKDKIRLTAPGKTSLVYGDGELLIAAGYYFYVSGDKTILSTFGEKPALEKGIGIAGGIAETEIDGKHIFLRVHGNSGKRVFSFPFPLRPGPVKKDAVVINQPKSAEIRIDYKSPGPGLLANEQGYTEYEFYKK